MSTPSPEPDPTSPTVPPGLIALHEPEQDQLGAYYCTHCTPTDTTDPAEQVPWPCLPLQQAGMTISEAIDVVELRRAEASAEPEAGAL